LKIALLHLSYLLRSFPFCYFFLYCSFFSGKSPEEIRKTFNIVNDFTPEEEEQVRRENEWCEDR
jgi:hypothetical protein